LGTAGDEGLTESRNTARIAYCVVRTA
jgi:hypothetical protein